MIREFIIAFGARQMVRKTYSSHGWAQRELNRLKALPDRSRPYGVGFWDVVSRDEFRARDHYITVKNLLTGKPVQILASEEGTSSDPSTEMYWSM